MQNEKVKMNFKFSNTWLLNPESSLLTLDCRALKSELALGAADPVKSGAGNNLHSFFLDFI